jgi:ATP-dependent helicase HrpB
MPRSVPQPPGERKIVLATTIAETSLTIDGIGAVIDTGFKRVPRFDPASGMTALETVRVSLASADQRRGRAGRLGPGIGYRLWPEAETRALKPHDEPEIFVADLAPLVLELAAWGVSDPQVASLARSAARRTLCPGAGPAEAPRSAGQFPRQDHRRWESRW